jgi:hypothetical protein
MDFLVQSKVTGRSPSRHRYPNDLDYLSTKGNEISAISRGENTLPDEIIPNGALRHARAPINPKRIVAA